MTTRSKSGRTLDSRLAAGAEQPTAKQTRQRGRFREIDPAKRRTRLVKVYLTDGERERVSRNAGLASLSVSNFARQCVLGTQIESKADLRVVGQLSQHFGLIKKLLSELDDIKDVTTRRAALAELAELRHSVKASLIAISAGFRGKVERNEGGR